MAKTATSVYVSIVTNTTHKTEVGPKQFFNAAAAKTWIKEQKDSEKYPPTEYHFVTETY